MEQFEKRFINIIFMYPKDFLDYFLFQLVVLKFHLKFFRKTPKNSVLHLSLTYLYLSFKNILEFSPKYLSKSLFHFVFISKGLVGFSSDQLVQRKLKLDLNFTKETSH